MSTPASRPGPRLNLRGAVDLSGLGDRSQRPAAAPSGGAVGGPAAPAGASPAAGGAPGGPRVVVDVTDAEFASLVQLSAQIPVVVDLWATWCGPCKQLSPVLERLAEEHAGAFLLAKVDVDENQQIAAAFQVQSVPTVVAILAGQPVPLFQGAQPEPQVRQVLEELLRVAAQNGITGRVPVTGPGSGTALGDDGQDGAAPAEPPLPPLHAEAEEAIARDDLDAAAAAYERALAEAPADVEAQAGLARVGVLRRTAGADPAAVRAAAEAPGAQAADVVLAADLDLLDGDVEGAFARLVAFVRTSAGDERDAARTHLVDLFAVVGADDERVAPARRALAAALY